MKDSALTATDQFCGAGGSSQGARNAGVKVKMALNHWKLAIETHNTNFPDTDHDCTDISACDPRRYPSTNILLTSPECTTHSPAGGNRHRKVSDTMDLFQKGIIDPATERSRATMWDVCRFAEYHSYEIIIVENVVEARTKWVLFDVWLQAMHRLGYRHRCKYLNSMHFWPTPQSRDRMYVVFWKSGNKEPDLDFHPLAYCSCCGKDIHAVQNWKNPERKFGKYRTQYLYVCPVDGAVVEPYYYAAFNAIDWNDIGTKIGDRKKPLSINTERRIKYGLKKYGNHPLVINVRQPSGLFNRVKSVSEVLGTQCTETSHSITTPFVIKGEHTHLTGYVKSVNETFYTQTARQTNALITPWIIEMNKTGECKPASSPTSTITAGGINHAILASAFITESRGQSKTKPIVSPLGTQTQMINHGIVTDENMKTFLSYYNRSQQASGINDPMGTIPTHDRVSVVSYEKPVLEECHYRMIKPPEVKASMGFDPDYKILGSGKDQVKQCGNAVTPPVQEWIIGQCVKSLEA